MASKPIPIIRMSLLRPFVNKLQRFGVDAHDLLQSVELEMEAINSAEQTIGTEYVDKFISACVNATGYRQFACYVGEQLDPDGWPMIQSALESAQSLADFLCLYIEGASQVSASVRVYLSVKGDTAVFGQERTNGLEPNAYQRDAFVAGLSIAFLRHFTEDLFDPLDVVVVVSDPSILSDSVRECQSLRGDGTGCYVRFPSNWLVQKRAESTYELDKIGQGDFLKTFRTHLGQHIRLKVLNAKDAARIVGMNQTKLARQLNDYDTTISKELERAKMEYAKEVLGTDAKSVKEVAHKLGYSDPSNFSRAFKRLFKQSPTVYREKQMGSHCKVID